MTASFRVVRAAEDGLIVPLLSKPLVDEYSAVLSDGSLHERFSSLSSEFVDVMLSRLRFVSDYVRKPRVCFAYPRDPLDERRIELSASHIITGDQDLLSLPTNNGNSGKRYRQRLPRTEILKRAGVCTAQ